MPLSLNQILYVSVASPAATSLLGIAEILGEAKRNNDRRDITGALAVGNGAFLQVLEGPRHELDRLLERLRADPRHSALQILDQRRIATRRFAAWSMKGPLASPEMVALVEAARRPGLDIARTIDALAG